MKYAKRFIESIGNPEAHAYAAAYYNYQTSSRSMPDADSYKITELAAFRIRRQIAEAVNKDQQIAEKSK
jgi:hypothetical protein